MYNYFRFFHKLLELMSQILLQSVTSIYEQENQP